MTDVFDDAAKEWNVDPTLLRAISAQESGGNPQAVSKAGAGGLMGVLPDTAREMGATDPNDIRQNVYAGAKYLSQALDAEKTPEDALRYYHGGPKWRDAYGPESQAYVPAVIAQHKRITAANAPPQGASDVPAPAKDTSAKSQIDDFLARTASDSSADSSNSKGNSSNADLPAWAGGVPPPAAAAPASTPAPAPAASGKASPSDQIAAFIARTAPGEDKPEAPSASAAPAGGEYGLTGEPGEFDKQQPLTLGPLERIGQAAKQGFIETPNPLMSPELQAILERNGPIGQGTSFVLQAARNPLALVGGAGRGLQQAITEAGGGDTGPGRDIAAALPLIPAFQGVAPAIGANALAGGVRSAATAIPRAVGDVVRRVGEADKSAADVLGPAGDFNALNPRAADMPTMTVRPGEAPAEPPNFTVSPDGTVRAAGAPGEAGPSAGMGGPQTASVGAAASREGTAAEALTERTPEQKIADLEKDVKQTAEDRAGPQMQDHNVYVKGVERPLAAREFSAKNSLDDKVSSDEDTAYRTAQDKLNKENNIIMVDKLANDAGDANTIKALHDERDEVAPNAQKLFEDEKPVDASSLVESIDKVLAGQAGKREAVTRTLGKVRASLFDKEGNLETLPSQIYGARQNITDLLKKTSGEGSDDARAARAFLTQTLDQFDDTINKGAPKYEAYLKDFHEASQPINQQEFLQKYQTGTKKLTGADGYLQLNKVQKMLDDVLQGMKAKGINNAKSLTDEQIQNIVNVRNELAANQLRDRLGKVKGSDTFQKTNRAGVLGAGPLGVGVRAAAEIGAHAALASATGGIGNMALAGYRGVVKPMIEASQAEKAANALAARKQQLLSTTPNPLQQQQ